MAVAGKTPLGGPVIIQSVQTAKNDSGWYIEFSKDEGGIPDTGQMQGPEGRVRHIVCLGESGIQL